MSKLLSTDFKFGFELEAYVHESALYKYGYSPIKNIKGKLPKDMYDEKSLYMDINKWLKTIFGEMCYIEEDGSLNRNQMVGAFEFPSPVLQLTPKNIKKCVKFLDEMRSHPIYKVYTNENCGFHIHLSFQGMDNKDMIWIISHIAMNDEYIKLFNTFDNNMGMEYNFVSKQYANDNFLFLLRDAIQKHDEEKIGSLISNYKYRLIRLHPQGTLEWRGPRNFLNKDNKKVIWLFFKQLIKICNIIKDIMEMKTISKMSKEEYFNLLEPSAVTYKIPSSTIDRKFIYYTYKNPKLLLELNDNSKMKIVEKIFFNYFPKNRDGLDEWLKPLRNKNFNNIGILSQILHYDIDFLNYIDKPFIPLMQLYDIENSLFMDKLASTKYLTKDVIGMVLKNLDIGIYYTLSAITSFSSRFPTVENPFLNKEIIDLIIQKYGKSAIEIRLGISFKNYPLIGKKIIELMK